MKHEPRQFFNSILSFGSGQLQKSYYANVYKTLEVYISECFACDSGRSGNPFCGVQRNKKIGVKHAGRRHRPRCSAGRAV
ncbi:MAG TPA: hypothetical protein VF691_05445 [Cytophagaceae bacterium]